MSADYEAVSCVKNEVFVYKIPPRPSNRGYRAADWTLDKPDWTGRLRVVAKGKTLSIKLEDKNSGELFAQCPVESYPGVTVEQVTDSSRYFVLKIVNDNGMSAFIGVGFADRGDSFDLNVALQDHFKWLKQESEIEKQGTQLDSGPKLDLGFKEGQTIKINLAGKTTKPREKKSGAGGGIGLLPPPPGGFRIAPPSSSGQRSQPPQVQPVAPTVQSVPQSSDGNNTDLFAGLSAPPPTQPASGVSDPFAALSNSSNSDSSGDNPWVQF